MSRQIAGNRKIFQDSKVTNPSQIKRQSHYHTKMSKARTVKDKDFQEITQSMAMPAIIGFPLSLYVLCRSKLPSRIARALLVSRFGDVLD